jgi:RNA polymerase sigma factor (sigma-70 family)
MPAVADPIVVSPPKDPDAQIIRDLAAGDPQAAADLARRFQRPLRAFLARLVGGDEQLAAELVQDTLVAVWKGAADFDGRSRVSTWVFAIAHRQAATALRRRRLPTLPLTDELRAPPAPSPVEHDDLRQALAALPTGQHAVLELTFTFGFSYREIAEILQIPEGTVKSRASAARHALRKALDNNTPWP